MGVERLLVSSPDISRAFGRIDGRAVT